MYLLPFQESPDAEQFASGLSQTVLSASGSFILYGHRTSEAFWEHWFERRPELTGWTSRRLGAFGDVMAVEFAKR
jgi:hypothetical protein